MLLRIHLLGLNHVVRQQVRH
eukprot:SAG31_NODE_46011_length_256_cov_0.662420_1_plen_20_part_10